MDGRLSVAAACICGAAARRAAAWPGRGASLASDAAAHSPLPAHNVRLFRCTVLNGSKRGDVGGMSVGPGAEARRACTGRGWARSRRADAERTGVGCALLGTGFCASQRAGVQAARQRAQRWALRGAADVQLRRGGAEARSRNAAAGARAAESAWKRGGVVKSAPCDARSVVRCAVRCDRCALREDWAARSRAAEGTVGAAGRGEERWTRVARIGG